MSKETYELSFHERALIACLMEPILDWKDEKRINELWQLLTAGDKGSLPNDEEYKQQMIKELSELRDKLGFE